MSRIRAYWWLVPAVLALLFVGGLLIGESGATSPFIYTAF